jgi:hypothetical protein
MVKIIISQREWFTKGFALSRQNVNPIFEIKSQAKLIFWIKQLISDFI